MIHRKLKLNLSNNKNINIVFECIKLTIDIKIICQRSLKKNSCYVSVKKQKDVL